VKQSLIWLKCCPQFPHYESAFRCRPVFAHPYTIAFI